MKRKTVSVIMFSLLLIGMLILTFNIQPAKASGTIYIRADGSIEPLTANITTVDNVTYYFSDNNYDEIVVERDNIVLDGAGYTLQGTGSGTGIDLSDRSNVTIKNMEVKTFGIGIYLYYSSYNSISGNNITNNMYGIEFSYSSNNTVSGNDITNSSTGVRVYKSDYNIISGNSITNNDENGIALNESSSNTLSGNEMNGSRYNFRVEGSELHHFLHSVDNSNRVDGKPVYYWINQHEAKEIPSNAGYVALVNCTQIIVTNITLTHNRQGLLLAYTNNSRITDNNLTNNHYGIYLIWSSNNTISGNNITNNIYGVHLYSSSNNTLRNNGASDNKYNFGVYGSLLSHYIQNITDSNTVDGKPVYYWVNKRDINVPLDAGWVALINCTRITVQNLNLTDNGQGVLLAFATNSAITKNDITNSSTGVRVYKSDYNIISGNSITNNDENGISLDYTSNNTISENSITSHYYGLVLYNSSCNKFYHNNFMNNTEQVDLYESYNNVWDNGYPSGGNYWGVYSDVDVLSGPYQNETGSDGIWDHPYVVNASNTDNYPLRQPYYGSVRNLNTGQSYPTIQESYNNSSERDRILVLSGTYHEHLVLNQCRRALIGENISTTIIDGNYTGTVIDVFNNRITISGFTIQNSGSKPRVLDAGIKISGNLITIIGNHITGNEVGIYVRSLGNNILANNVTNNWYGIWLSKSIGVTIEANNLTANMRGIYLDNSSNNIIIGNSATKSSTGGHGIYLSSGSSNNTILRNNLTNNSYGIWLEESFNNSMVENTIANNEILGINLTDSPDNIIYHNSFINNTKHVGVNQSNSWDDGYPSGGNYWNDYSGTDLYSGPFQNLTGKDGIIDTPYIIDSNNQDNYPLVEPYVSGNLTVTVYTDKFFYISGDMLYLGLDVTNPGPEIMVDVHIWLEKPDTATKTFLYADNITLQAGLNYSNPSQMTFGPLPIWLPPGMYTWHAALLDPTTHDIIVEDTAAFLFFG